MFQHGLLAASFIPPARQRTLRDLTLPRLRLALRGRVTEHHRLLLGQSLRHLDLLDELIGPLRARIEQLTAPDAEAVELLTAIPGVTQRTADALVAEVGPTAAPFPTAAQFVSWAGLCPGDNASTGQRRTGRTRQANQWLRRAVVQASWAASHAKGTSLAARYRRVCQRRVPRRTLPAVGHELRVIVYQVLKRRAPYRELGADYDDRLVPDRRARYLARQLEQLGHKVTLAAKDPEATLELAGASQPELFHGSAVEKSDRKFRKRVLAFWHGHQPALPDRPDQPRVGPGLPRHPGPQDGRPTRPV